MNTSQPAPNPRAASLHAPPAKVPGLLQRTVTACLSRSFNWFRLRGLPGHRRRVRASRQVLQTLRGFQGPAAAARAFGLLRSIDPLLMEEVVLSALEDSGHLVIRNRWYTGDGGLDGRLVVRAAGLWPWRLWAIQVKRHGAAINAAHVAHFHTTLSAGRYVAGLFVHTGRTGPASRQALRGTNIRMVSGEALLALLLAGRSPIHGTQR